MYISPASIFWRPFGYPAASFRGCNLLKPNLHLVHLLRHLRTASLTWDRQTFSLPTISRRSEAPPKLSEVPMLDCWWVVMEHLQSKNSFIGETAAPDTTDVFFFFAGIFHCTIWPIQFKSIEFLTLLILTSLDVLRVYQLGDSNVPTHACLPAQSLDQQAWRRALLLLCSGLSSFQRPGEGIGGGGDSRSMGVSGGWRMDGGRSGGRNPSNKMIPLYMTKLVKLFIGF